MRHLKPAEHLTSNRFSAFIVHCFRRFKVWNSEVKAAAERAAREAGAAAGSARLPRAPMPHAKARMHDPTIRLGIQKDTFKKKKKKGDEVLQSCTFSLRSPPPSPFQLAFDLSALSPRRAAVVSKYGCHQRSLRSGAQRSNNLDSAARLSFVLALASTSAALW